MVSCGLHFAEHENTIGAYVTISYRLMDRSTAYDGVRHRDERSGRPGSLQNLAARLKSEDQGKPRGAIERSLARSRPRELKSKIPFLSGFTARGAETAQFEEVRHMAEPGLVIRQESDVTIVAFEGGPPKYGELTRDPMPV